MQTTKKLFLHLQNYCTLNSDLSGIDNRVVPCAGN